MWVLGEVAYHPVQPLLLTPLVLLGVQQQAVVAERVVARGVAAIC